MPYNSFYRHRCSTGITYNRHNFGFVFIISSANVPTFYIITYSSLSACRKAPSILIVTTFLLSFASMVHVLKTEPSPTIGATASSFATCSLWTFLFAQDLAFIAQILFSFRKNSNDSDFFLSSLDRSFACFGSKMLYLLN